MSVIAQRLELVRRAADRGDWPVVVVEAEELLDVDPDHPEGLLLLANASLELGDCLNAVAAYEAHLSHSTPSADALSGLGLARLDCCDIAGAIEAATAALRIDPDLAEAHYTLSLCFELTPGRSADAARAMAAANLLAPDAYPWPMQLGDEAFEDAIREAVHAIPGPLARFWSGVPMRLEEKPALAELVRGPTPIPPTVAGLYMGTPPAPEVANSLRPTALRLFRRNLARCGDLDGVQARLEEVLMHEALDWLGLPPDAF